MYMSEISKSKVSGLKAQKMIILLTLKHVSAISEHPVPKSYYKVLLFQNPPLLYFVKKRNLPDFSLSLTLR